MAMKIQQVSEKENMLYFSEYEEPDLLSVPNDNQVSDEENDVVFVKEFKTNSNINTPKISSPVSPLLQHSTESINNICKKYKKRNQKKYEGIKPRRNPKRQVQIDKEFYKLLDDIVWTESKKENKIRKNCLKTNKYRMERKSYRNASKVQTNCGAVYSPPSPLTVEHIRKWPRHGMHERPEYNTKTGKIEPFDYTIRQIAENYNMQRNLHGTSDDTFKCDEDNKTNEESVHVLTHNNLHHMIAYIASVTEIEKTTSNDDDKIKYLNVLNLVENKNGSQSDEIEFLNNGKNKLKELLKSTILMYCITNEVDQYDLIKYIDSINLQEVIDLSNIQFNLIPEN